MGAGTDLHRLVALPLVHERVHVAHDRIADLVSGPVEEVVGPDRPSGARRGEQDRCAGHRGEITT